MRRILTIFTILAIAGCSPDAYRADADRQVRKLIHDRQLQTTGYSTDTQVAPTTQPAPARKAYDPVPLTTRPRIEGSPINRVVFQLPVEPMGPPMFEESELPDVENAIFSEAYQIQRTRLEYGPPAGLGNVIKLELFSSIEYAVQHSRTYQEEMERLYLAALDVTLERHLFTPRPFVTTDLNYTGGQGDVAYRSALSVTQRAGVRQKLPYGGEIVAEGLVDFVHALNDNVTDGESAQLALNGSIPLWRGAGMINLEPLIDSERELIYATRSFESYRRNFSIDVASRYFRVLTTYSGLRNRLINYRNLLDLVERTQALFTAGRVTVMEIQRAQQQLLLAEDLLNRAQFTLQSELDDFKVFLGMPVEQPLELTMVDVQVSVMDEAMGDPEALALRYRLDLQTARDRIDDARRGVANAANQLGPQLDLTGGATVGNRADTNAKNIDSRTLEYNAGLSLDLPVDRLSERNSYRRSLIALEQARRRAVDLEQNVLADVRSARRSIRSAQYSLDIQRAGIDLARRRLDFANESLLQGRVRDSREVVEAQSSLLNAQDAFDRARADLQIQMLQYLRDTGTLRVDPDAGVLGLAMKRYAMEQTKP